MRIRIVWWLSSSSWWWFSSSVTSVSVSTFLASRPSRSASHRLWLTFVSQCIFTRLHCKRTHCEVMWDQIQCQCCLELYNSYIIVHCVLLCTLHCILVWALQCFEQIVHCVLYWQLHGAQYSIVHHALYFGLSTAVLWTRSARQTPAVLLPFCVTYYILEVGSPW